MTQKLTRQIVGYDPTSESVSVEYYIPTAKWEQITALIPQHDDDPYYVYNYPLDIRLANDIMAMIGERGAQDLHYFLECNAGD